MDKTEIVSRLDDAKNLLDSVYMDEADFGGRAWVMNKLTTIDLLIKEVIESMGE